MRLTRMLQDLTLTHPCEGLSLCLAFSDRRVVPCIVSKNQFRLAGFRSTLFPAFSCRQPQADAWRERERARSMLNWKLVARQNDTSTG